MNMAVNAKNFTLPYFPCEQANPKHQRCEMYIESVHKKNPKHQRCERYIEYIERVNKQKTKHQRCERYIERVYLIPPHDIPFAPLRLTMVISTFSIHLSSLWDLGFGFQASFYLWDNAISCALGEKSVRYSRC